ncbi:MAG TPA: hypothetical protein VFE14_18840 [Micromonosporaceae bacterium]|jgi:hypothetical protein|nr:hypothetical protein [Micromonosporaceae bacterium]
MPITDQVLENTELEHPSGSVNEELDQLMASDPASREECPVTTFSKTPCCF